MSVDEIVRDVHNYKSYLSFSGGGVTVTGGEPLMQPEFLISLLAACKAEGIHTVLDTSGYTTAAIAERALAHTDLLILDIKSINPATYKEVTGVPIDRTLEMLQISSRLNVPVWVRFVLVPGLTDDMGDLQRLADFLRTFNNIQKKEVLAFHKAGEYKWKNINIPYELEDVQPPTPELLAQAQQIFEN
jgi:pyruvate formate lyase activating enzyme